MVGGDAGMVVGETSDGWDEYSSPKSSHDGDVGATRAAGEGER